MRKILSYFMVFLLTIMSLGLKGENAKAATTFERTVCRGWQFNITINQSSPYGRIVSSSNSDVATATITGTQQFYDSFLKVTWYYAVVTITSKSPGTAVLSLSQSSQKIRVIVLEDTWDEGVITTEPTCSQDGVKTYTCSFCGRTKEEIIKTMVDHTWADEYSLDEEANCTESGSKSIYCTVCGEQKENSIISIPAKGHDLVKIDAKEETCTESGNKCYWYCNICHKYFNDEKATEETTPADVTLLANGIHTWDKGEITVAATATSAGVKTYKCTSCGAKKLISKTNNIRIKKLKSKKKYYFQIRAYSIDTDVSKRYAKWSNKYKIKTK